MMKFSGYEYVMIDISNQFGNDKLSFEDRIRWVHENMDDLESLVDQAETQPLYMKAVMTLRKAQKGIPSGHLVGFDACASGIQVMSALTGCYVGAKSTGLVGDERSDVYTLCTAEMNNILHTQGLSVDISRKDAKRALMTSYYGSKAVPKELFGEDTPELTAFYQAAQAIAPGAWELLQDLLASWQPFALKHQWKLPDGYDAVVKVMEKVSARIEIDELEHATFTYEFHENIGTKTGLSNVANAIHSVDAYVLRCIHRRCNYDPSVVETAYVALLAEKDLRDTYGVQPCGSLNPDSKLAYYLEQAQRSGMVDVVVLPYIKDGKDTQYLPTEYLEKLLTIVEGMLQYTPFPVVTIHDEFKCHPNKMNHLRQQYINVFAELAESRLLDDILSQIHGIPGTFVKLSQDLGDHIRNSNYALS